MGPGCIERSPNHGGGVSALAFSPEGRRLASGCDGGTIKIWDVARGALLAGPIQRGGAIAGMAFLDDGETLAVASEDGQVEFWNPRKGETIRRTLSFGKPIAMPAVDRTGAVVAVGGAGGLAIWTSDGNDAFRLTRGDNEGVIGLRCSDSGRQVFAARADGRIEVIEAKVGRIDPFVQHRDRPVGSRGIRRSGRQAPRCRRSTRPIVGLPLRNRGRRTDRARPRTAQGGCSIGRLADIDRGLRRLDSLLVRRHRTGDEPAFAVDGRPISALTFSGDGRRFAVAGWEGRIRCGKTPEPVECDSERILAWVGTTTELEFAGDDTIKKLEAPLLWDLKRRLSELGGPPIKEPKRRS